MIDSQERLQDVTALLEEWAEGNPQAEERLLEVVYRELRNIAGQYLWKERRQGTLQPTELVHEAYLRLVDQRQQNWRNRSHFFAIASKMMRRILVDHARKRVAKKRGGQIVMIPLAEVENLMDGGPEQLLALEDALQGLTDVDPRKGQIVELRFFGGLSFGDIARHLEISTATLNRHWRIAKAWLYRYLETPA